MSRRASAGSSGSPTSSQRLSRSTRAYLRFVTSRVCLASRTSYESVVRATTSYDVRATVRAGGNVVRVPRIDRAEDRPEDWGPQTTQAQAWERGYVHTADGLVCRECGAVVPVLLRMQ